MQILLFWSLFHRISFLYIDNQSTLVQAMYITRVQAIIWTNFNSVRWSIDLYVTWLNEFLLTGNVEMHMSFSCMKRWFRVPRFMSWWRPVLTPEYRIHLTNTLWTLLRNFVQINIVVAWQMDPIEAQFYTGQRSNQVANYSHVKNDHDDVIKWEHFPRYWPFVSVSGGFLSQRLVTHSFDVFFDLCLNKCLSKQLKCR